jgi:hypothetical protein
LESRAIYLSFWVCSVAVYGHRGNRLAAHAVPVMPRATEGNVGFIKQAKQDAVAAEAHRAVEEGRKVFAAKLNTPMTSTD